MPLQGKRVVVTGASRGIGRAIAVACAEAGASAVGVNYFRSEAAARELAGRFPGRVWLLRFDVRDERAVEEAVRPFREDAPIDGWVNNAGVGHRAPLVRQGLDSVREQLDVNLLGSILGARAALRSMMRSGGGSIVNVSSVSAVRPAAGQAAYAATKGAVEALTRALAVEYAARGVRVNCVRPGMVQTDMLRGLDEGVRQQVVARTPLGRLCLPEEVARAVVYLLSDESAFITGHVQAVDGGFSLG